MPKLMYFIPLISMILAAPAVAQQFESSPRSTFDAPRGYLGPSRLDYRATLPPPPDVGSASDRIDVSVVTSLQVEVSKEHWAMAREDAAYVYPRFEAALASPIDRTHSPKLIYLLNRVERDIATQAFAAKHEYSRLRPYQRLRLAHVCGFDAAPLPDPNAVDRSSYPSGHSAYGWAVALVLAQVAPERETQVLARAQDYELSRVICGEHFPSDVEAGHALAIAVFTQLTANPEFGADLRAAEAEHAAQAARQLGH